jgi:hypothetical protein
MKVPPRPDRSRDPSAGRRTGDREGGMKGDRDSLGMTNWDRSVWYQQTRPPNFDWTDSGVEKAERERRRRP